MFWCAEKRRELLSSARIKHPMTNHQSTNPCQKKTDAILHFPKKYLVPGVYVPGMILFTIIVHQVYHMICSYDSTIFDKCTTAIF